MRCLLVGSSFLIDVILDVLLAVEIFKFIADCIESTSVITMVNQVVPGFIFLKRSSVSNHEQKVLGTSYCHIQSFFVGQKAKALSQLYVVVGALLG